VDAKEWAAWIGALAGVGALSWNVFNKLREGPKLGVKVRCYDFGTAPTLRQSVLVTIRNTGTTQTTVTDITFNAFRVERIGWMTTKKWARKWCPKAIDDDLPKTIEVGSEVVFSANDSSFIDGLRLNGLEWQCDVWHAFAKDPVCVKVPDPYTLSDLERANRPEEFK
jgi:hypothetical protein